MPKNPDIGFQTGNAMSQRIEDYALIGNTHTAALVGRDGSIDWLCVPRFDSAACFAALLGQPSNGRWLICPKEKPRRIHRRYREGTLILETTFEVGSGSVTLIDFMPSPRNEDTADLVRIVRGDSGSVPMQLEAIFRFDYGRIAPWVRRQEHGLSAIAGPNALQVYTPLGLRGKGMTTVAEFSVGAGDMVPCILSWYPAHKDPPSAPDGERLLESADSWWKAWSSQYKEKGKWCEGVSRSLITLKALTYSPTGGIVAAPTTSLPEQIGGVRNWDYRYCWLRDATFVLYALLISNYKEEARAWGNWLRRAVAGEPSRLQIMYGLAGERRLSEINIPWLAGYEKSAPVRIGNGAHTQRQMDIYGEIMDVFDVTRNHGIAIEADIWEIQRQLMKFLERHWADSGSGIWEMRGDERQFTHSRVMTWVAVDRAIKAVERFGLSGPVDSWRSLRTTIHDDICRHGFAPDRNTFVQAYGSKELDASLLLIPLVGFLPPTDPRVIGTVEAIQRELTNDGFVLRYRTKSGTDALPSGEGAFLACSFWLTDNLALMGRYEEAQQLFERLLAIRNDVGLLAEEYDSRTRRQLGNFPQAFSHVGLINAAHNLALEQGPAKHRSKQGAD